MPLSTDWITSVHRLTRCFILERKSSSSSYRVSDWDEKRASRTMTDWARERTSRIRSKTNPAFARRHYVRERKRRFRRRKRRVGMHYSWRNHQSSKKNSDKMQRFRGGRPNGLMGRSRFRRKAKRPADDVSGSSQDSA